MKTYKIIYAEEQEVHEWTLEDILDHINEGRSNEWTDYDESDWLEGWNEWVAHEGYYTLVDEDECVVIDAEADTVDDDFQHYVRTNGDVVPRGTPIGIEYKEKLYLFF